MSNKPIVIVNVSLQTATVTRKGFGTPIFISSHNNFPERVRTYTSLTGVADDFNPTEAAYVAAQQIFSSTPSVAEFKIGRRLVDSTLTPTEVADGSVHEVTLTVLGGDTLDISVVAGVGDDEEAVSTAIKVAIDASALASKITSVVTGVGALGTLVLSRTTVNDSFSTSKLSKVTTTLSTSTELAAEVLDAITIEDDSFYFVTADDHSDVFVLAMAGAVEARTLFYFTANSYTTSYSTPYTVPSVLSTYERTVVFWSQAANTVFPECAYVGANATYAPDETAVVWSGIKVAGVPLALNEQGNKLTATQEKNLFDRSMVYHTTTAVGPRVLGGKTANGTWIDEVHIRDTIVARVQEAQEALVLNQAGGKLEGGRTGVALSDAALTESLTPFIASKALESFTTDPSSATIDQNTRTLSNMKFEGVLQGAIIRVVINGTLVNATV